MHISKFNINYFHYIFMLGYKNHGIKGLRKIILKLKLDAYESDIDILNSTDMILLEILI